jgi:hypothetical protein
MTSDHSAAMLDRWAPRARNRRDRWSGRTAARMRWRCLIGRLSRARDLTSDAAGCEPWAACLIRSNETALVIAAVPAVPWRRACPYGSVAPGHQGSDSYRAPPHP